MYVFSSEKRFEEKPQHVNSTYKIDDLNSRRNRFFLPSFIHPKNYEQQGNCCEYIFKAE
jgi:hypothetical protein